MGLAVAQAVVAAVAVAGRDELVPGLRVVLVGCLALQVLFAWGTGRRRAGAALGLLLLEGTTVLAALGGVDAAPPVRLALATSGLAVVGLVLASLHAFPPPVLPRTEPPSHR